MKPRAYALAAAVVAALCAATPSVAASLTVTDISAAWSSSTPTVDGLGTRQIRWGRPAETNRSGYNFTSSEVPFTVEDQNEFVIGEFSHENFPVFGTFLRAASLTVQFMVVGVETPITSVFSFRHLETLNDPESGQCRDGGTVGSGINIAGCADRVTAVLNREQSESFEIDGVTYILDILGFQRDGERFEQFWTQENLSNSAELIALFRVEDRPPVSEVPLPASGWLLIAGLSGLGLMRHRR